MASTLELVATGLGQALVPFADSLDASDADIQGFVRLLGWELPIVPAGFGDFHTASSALVGALAELQSATMELDEASATDGAVLERLALPLLPLVVLPAAIRHLPP